MDNDSIDDGLWDAFEGLRGVDIPPAAGDESNPGQNESRRGWWVGAVAAAAALLVFALVALPKIGSDGDRNVATANDGGSAGPTLSCETDFDEVQRLLRPGIISSHIDVADVSELLDHSDAVVIGVLESIERTRSDLDDETDYWTWTTVSIDVEEVLHSPGDPQREVSKFSFRSNWARGQGPDPIESPVAVDGARILAFLNEWDAPGGFTGPIQGMAFDCAGSTNPAQPVILDLPPDIRSLPLDEMATAVREAGLEELRTSIDGPLMRHPERAEVIGGSDAEIEGLIELEAECLYLSSEEFEVRYPVVWPADTTWDASRQVVITPTGAEIGIGDIAAGGGGYMEAAGLESFLGPEAAALATSCVDNETSEVAVVNNFGDAIGPSLAGVEPDNGDDLPDAPPFEAGVLSPAELQDLATRAEQDGITLDEAIERFGWHDDFSHTVGIIRATQPGSLSDAKIAGPLTAEILLAGDLNDESKTALAAFEEQFPDVSVTIVTG